MDFLDRYDAWRGNQPANPAPAPNRVPAVTATVAGGSAYGRAALERECADLAATASGRNHRLNVAAFNLAGLVAAGHLGRAETIDALRAAATIASGRGDHPLTDHEIEATIKSAFTGSATKVGARHVPELAVNLNNVIEVGPADILPPRTATDDSDRAGTTTDDAVIVEIPAPTLEDIEQDFWQSRDSLALIYQAALSRMASPWAVLACCAARVLCMIPPAITLPPIIGGPGSLNWFAAIAAKSGGGKGASMTVSDQLVVEPVIMHGIGSGEGMIECYRRSGEPEDMVTAVMFSVDEIDTLAAMRGRQGQTTMTILRQGFSGERLGFSYRGRQGEQVESHTYRMTLVAAVQPGRAGALFDDAAGGTPQRFQWFPGRDKRITADPPQWPTDSTGARMTLTLPDPIELARHLGHVKVPQIVTDTVRQARAASMSGDDDALDGHALFCREKFAYFLAVIDGRTEIDDDDWRLSGIAADVSEWCRGRVQAGWLDEQGRQSRERGAMRAVERDEQTIVEHMTAVKHLGRISAWIGKILAANGAMSHAELHRRASSRDRPRLGQAITAAAEQGAIVLDGDGRWTLARD